uniref:Uncharacterized protein n=1 Tax=Chlorocebus sabaeus TaxID=60711 RepID=A0A0D9SEE2_CHLSB
MPEKTKRMFQPRSAPTGMQRLELSPAHGIMSLCSSSTWGAHQMPHRALFTNITSLLHKLLSP